MNEAKQYPLTASQQVLVYAGKYHLGTKWMNVAAVVDFQNEIDEAKMLKAIAISLMQTPGANIRLHRNEDKSITQYFSHEIISGVELVDLSSLSSEQYEKKLESWAQTTFPNKSFDTQLVNFKLIRRPGGLCSIYLCVDHMVMDAYSIMSTVRYIMSTYKALAAGTELPKEQPSPIPMYESEMGYFRSENFKKDMAFWTRLFAEEGEPYFTSLDGKNSKHRHKQNSRVGKITIPFRTKGVHENQPISADIVSGIVALAGKWRVSPQSLYHLAYNTYLSTVCDTDDVTLPSAVARRATLTQKRAGGTMVNPVFVRSKIDRKNTSFQEGCKYVYQRTTEAYRHANLPYGMISGNNMKTFHVPAGYAYTGFSLCYQPYFSLQEDDMAISFRRLNNGDANQSCYLTIMPRDNSGEMWCNYEYMTAYYKRETILACHEFVVKFLKAALEDPDAMLADLAAKAL